MESTFNPIRKPAPSHPQYRQPSQNSPITKTLTNKTKTTPIITIKPAKTAPHNHNRPNPLNPTLTIKTPNNRKTKIKQKTNNINHPQLTLQ